MLPQALEIIFEVQRKRNNENLIIIKINFPTYKTFFIFYPSLNPSYFETSQFFLISYSFKTI